MNEVIKVDSWMPDYSLICDVCDAGHVVTGISGNKVVYHGSMCGVCTWGEADMADPDNWND